MYCTHCAKKLSDKQIEKLESEKSSVDPNVEMGEGYSTSYVCPRCGHLIHRDLSEEEIKSLARASHAQIQRARNRFASGMGMLSIGLIALILAVVFFLLARKPSNGYVLVTDCAEFYVFIALGLTAVVLLVLGAVFFSLGLIERKRNEALLRDINNKTFVQ